jgi:hypothetical protein
MGKMKNHNYGTKTPKRLNYSTCNGTYYSQNNKFARVEERSTENNVLKVVRPDDARLACDRALQSHYSSNYSYSTIMTSKVVV